MQIKCEKKFLNLSPHTNHTVKKHLPALLSIVFLFVTAASAYAMWQRTQDQQLWGYRPLLLLLAGWGAIAAFRYWRAQGKTGMESHPRWMGLSTLSGILLGLGFPGLLPFPLLLFVGWVPLLLLLKELEATGASWRRVFRYSYHTFVVWNILATYWVANTAMIAGLLAILINSAFMSTVVVLAMKSRKRMPRFGFLILAVYWIAFEYLHINWELTWPWLTLGNGFAQWYPIVQWYEYTGVFGGSLWIWVANLLAFQAWQRYREQKKWPMPTLLRLAALIALPIAVSLGIYTTWRDEGPQIDVAIVQPNYEPHYEKFEIPERVQLERFLQLSSQVTDSLTDYLVFPETSFGLVESDHMNDYPSFSRLQSFIKPYPQLRIICGIDGYHIFKSGETHSDFVRSQTRTDGEVLHYEVFNAAVELSPAPNASIPLYKKSKLVPGPEILPYRHIFFFLKPLIERLDGTTAGLATQPERSIFNSGKAGIGPAICYESVFGEYFTGYIRKGAQAIFIMTNDGWWDNTAGHRQHLWYASLRAIETRRSIARAANTGISAFVNARGDISQPTAYGEQAAIRQKITLSDQLTLYVKWGDMIARIAIFLALLWLLNTIVGVRRAKP